MVIKKPISQQEALAHEAYLGISCAQRMVHKTAVNAGWYQDPETGKAIVRNIPETIALMHSELSEALEAYRKDLMDDHLPNRKGIEVEFADCIIRILDTAAYLKLDVAGALVAKNDYNQKRADHKLENRKKVGGKKF